MAAAAAPQEVLTAARERMSGMPSTPSTQHNAAHAGCSSATTPAALVSSLAHVPLPTDAAAGAGVTDGHIVVTAKKSKAYKGA
jgi:hypothetical protein